MTMNSLNARIGDQGPFAMDIDHRRARGLRVLRGLSLLLGLLVFGGWEAGQQSKPGSPL
jgi:hypothetical protein